MWKHLFCLYRICIAVRQTPPFLSLSLYLPLPLPHSVQKQNSFSALKLKLLSQQMSLQQGRIAAKEVGSPFKP